MNFNGKVVLITGASSGIGADAARHLTKLGAQVSIVGRNEQRLNEVYDQIKEINPNAALKIVADVTKDTERIVDATIKRFGKLDVLINNAGFAIGDSVITADLSEFDRVFNTNIRSVINLTKLCVPHLEKTKGNIVNVSSICGLKAMPGVMTYCMSKAALDQFTKCSALDLAPKGIRVNSINPAAMKTNFFEPFGESAENYEQRLNEYKKKYPVGRVGDVSDTSTAIAYLADNNATSFLTGILLPVDGGAMLVGF